MSIYLKLNNTKIIIVILNIIFNYIANILIGYGHSRRRFHIEHKICLMFAFVIFTISKTEAIFKQKRKKGQNQVPT
jgi:hypothetical protein